MKLHSVSLDQRNKPALFDKIIEWFKVIPEKFDDTVKQNR